MREPRRESPAWTYALEDAIFHGLCFGLLGPAIAFVILAVVSSLGSLPRAGFVQAMTDIVSFIGLLGTVYALMAFLVIAPMMLVSGLLVSAVARRVHNERWLHVIGFVVTAIMAVIFIPITGNPGHDNRLPFPWDGPIEIFVSGVTGFVLVRVTRFLRIWRDRATSARGCVSP